MKKYILVFTIIAVNHFIACNSGTKNNFVSEKETVTAKEADELLKGNALLIDVREPDEVDEQSYDVKNSVNIPLDSIESKINSIPKDQQVILACQRGGRSQKAFNLLKEKGFTNIANLDGGMAAWSDAGLPTKSALSETKPCCVDPNSTDCNPDGTCKTTASAKDNSNSVKTETQSTKSGNLVNNHLEVYAFHGTRQCETCKNMKANTRTALNKYFSEELKSGKIVFQIIDVDDSKNEKIAEKYQATGTALMVNNVVNGQDNIIDWSDFAFDKANDANEFIPELKTKISGLLK